MSNVVTVNNRVPQQDHSHQSTVKDEATNPAAEGVIASSSSPERLGADGPQKRMGSLRQAIGGTLQPWSVVRILLAALLVVTGVLKVTHSAALLASGGLLGSSTAIALVVGFEWFAATFIAIGPVRAAQRLAILLFSGFAAVAAWAWWTDQDCGCFGPQTPKGVPLLLDLIALLLVAWSVQSKRRSGTIAKPACQSLAASLIAGSMFAALGSGFTAWQINHQAAAQTMPSWFGENLIGKEFPLLADPRFAALVPEQGEALIVMLRPDCEHCRELIEQWPTISSQLAPSTKVIGISVSPNRWTVNPGKPTVKPLGISSELVIDWEGDEPFVTAPGMFMIQDRKVRLLPRGKSALGGFFVSSKFLEVTTPPR